MKGSFGTGEHDPPEMNGLFCSWSVLNGHNLGASAFGNERPLSLLVGFGLPVLNKIRRIVIENCLKLANLTPQK